MLLHSIVTAYSLILRFARSVPFQYVKWLMPRLCCLSWFPFLIKYLNKSIICCKKWHRFTTFCVSESECCWFIKWKNEQTVKLEERCLSSDIFLKLVAMVIILLGVDAQPSRCPNQFLHHLKNTFDSLKCNFKNTLHKNTSCWFLLFQVLFHLYSNKKSASDSPAPLCLFLRSVCSLACNFIP